MQLSVWELCSTLHVWYLSFYPSVALHCEEEKSPANDTCLLLHFALCMPCSVIIYPLQHSMWLRLTGGFQHYLWHSKIMSFMLYSFNIISLQNSTVEVYQVILRVCCFSHPAPPALADHRYCPVEIIIPEYLKRCVLSSHKRTINLAPLLAARVCHITERPRKEAMVHKEHEPCR